MENTSKTTTGGISFVGLLLIAFIVLKLCNVIKWSWWWVLCPLWLLPALFLIGFAIWIVFMLINKKRK